MLSVGVLSTGMNQNQKFSFVVHELIYGPAPESWWSYLHLQSPSSLGDRQASYWARMNRQALSCSSGISMHFTMLSIDGQEFGREINGLDANDANTRSDLVLWLEVAAFFGGERWGGTSTFSVFARLSLTPRCFLLVAASIGRRRVWHWSLTRHIFVTGKNKCAGSWVESSSDLPLLKWQNDDARCQAQGFAMPGGFAPMSRYPAAAINNEKIRLWTCNYTVNPSLTQRCAHSSRSTTATNAYLIKSIVESSIKQVKSTQRDFTTMVRQGNAKAILMTWELSLYYAILACVHICKPCFNKTHISLHPN